MSKATNPPYHTIRAAWHAQPRAAAGEGRGVSRYPRPTILNLGRIVAAIDRHRDEVDEFALHTKTNDPKETAFEDARDCLLEAVLILQDQALATRATSLGEAAIQAEFAWLKADKLTSCELSHQFAKGTLQGDLELLHRALASMVVTLAAALPDCGEDAACAKGIVDRSVALCGQIMERAV